MKRIIIGFLAGSLIVAAIVLAADEVLILDPNRRPVQGLAEDVGGGVLETRNARQGSSGGQLVELTGCLPPSSFDPDYAAGQPVNVPSGRSTFEIDIGQSVNEPTVCASAQCNVRYGAIGNDLSYFHTGGCYTLNGYGPIQYLRVDSATYSTAVTVWVPFAFPAS